MKKLVGAAAIAAALAVASPTSARTPTCSTVSYSLIESSFNIAPTGTTIAKTSSGMRCTYYFFLNWPPGVPMRCPQPGSCADGKPIGSMSVTFRAAATPTLYARTLAAHVSLTSVRKVSGVGDAAFVGRDVNGGGGSLVFLRGTHLVSISVRDSYEGGGGPGTAGFSRAIEGFARALVLRV